MDDIYKVFNKVMEKAKENPTIKSWHMYLKKDSQGNDHLHIKIIKGNTYPTHNYIKQGFMEFIKLRRKK